MQERLNKYPEDAVNLYVRYVEKLQTQKESKPPYGLKNIWATKITIDDWVAYFEKVAMTGLYIDGDNITIGNTGISLNYQAYKNLVIKKYPEATFDLQLVREGDVFSFKKENGKVIYNHEFSNPFSDRPYLGGYCVIKIRTGEFIEILSVKDLEQIRKSAKTDYIWREWTSEMYLKTIMKRACKRHFKDAVEALDRLDNENYDLETVTEWDLSECKTVEQITVFYKENVGKCDKNSKATLINACSEAKQKILGMQNANT